MSKTSVKKAISEFTPEQLRGLILDIHAKYKDAREYLDFFSDPDIEKTVERYRAAIMKEVNRVYRRSPRPRIGRIKTALKSFALLEPGFEAVAELMTSTARALIANGRSDRYSDTTAVQIARFVGDTCTFLERNGLLDDYLPGLEKAVDDIKLSSSPRNAFHNSLKSTLSPWIEKNEQQL